MRNRIAVKVLFAVLLVAGAIGAGIYGYNVGLAHGLAQSAAVAAAQSGPAAGPAVVFYPRPWGWGYGFGFFPFAPLFFIFFWVLIARALFWRGGRWRRGYGCGYGYGAPRGAAPDMRTPYEGL